MDKDGFYTWLLRDYTSRTSNSRLANCLRIEEYEGDLDAHFARDRGQSLVEKLTYTMEDELYGCGAKHCVPIEGNVYNGTATLKHAAKLYFKFKAGTILEETLGRNNQNTRNNDWQNWNNPTDDELYEVIKLTSQYTKFLHPDIIKKIVADNNEHREIWSDNLREKNITPEIYLWENSPCAFPGVRRYAGSNEIAYYRKQTQLAKGLIFGAVKLDDNAFPKQIWTFIFNGKKFQNQGPKNYALAHLADHKEHKNRMVSEFDIKDNSTQHPLFGLFTCPTNTVYIPTSLLRPTDFSPRIRRLLINKAYDLYGSFCNILPPWIELGSEVNDKWNHTRFQWADPVGTCENIELFLEFRNVIMDSLLR